MSSPITRLHHRYEECVLPQLFNSEKTKYHTAEGVEATWMITKCKHVDENSELCENPGLHGDIESILPVSYTDKDYHVTHFMNKHCAYCNSVARGASLAYWRFEIHCSLSISLTDEHVLAIIGEHGCNMFYRPPNPFRVERCNVPHYTISQCNQTGLWGRFNQTIDMACRAFVDPFNQTYKNYFCYVCNTDKVLPRDDWSCEDPYNKQPTHKPSFAITLNLEVLKAMKNDELLGCDLSKQFADFKYVSIASSFHSTWKKVKHPWRRFDLVSRCLYMPIKCHYWY